MRFITELIGVDIFQSFPITQTMQHKILAVFSLLASLGITLATPLAQAHLANQRAAAVAEPARTGVAQLVAQASGATEYLDDFNGFKLKVPPGFKLDSKGLTTTWIRMPSGGSGAATIYVNAAELKGVSSQVLYNAHLQQYKNNSSYTEVVPMKVKFGKKAALALRVKEINNVPGTRDQKGPEEIHRWHLFVFGNQRTYTWGFTGSFSDFQNGSLPAIYEDVIKSVELVTIKP